MISIDWKRLPPRGRTRTACRRIVGVGLLTTLLAPGFGCSPTTVPPAPESVHRIAVLPPHIPGPNAPATPTSGSLFNAPRLTLGDVLAAAVRLELARQGFQVVDPIAVDTALHGRAPANTQMAAQMAREAQLNTTAMFIDVPLWEPNNTGMRTDGVIVALNVALVDPLTGEVLWEMHRTPKPVPLYGVVLQGQAAVFVAETVMREILAPLGGEGSHDVDDGSLP
jgi:hypothetical protein